MQFGTLVRERRKKLGLTIAEVGERTGINPQYLAPVERGVFSPPSDEKIHSIARTLKLDPDMLFLLAGRLSIKLQEIVNRSPAKATKVLKGAA